MFFYWVLLKVVSGITCFYIPNPLLYCLIHLCTHALYVCVSVCLHLEFSVCVSVCHSVCYHPCVFRNHQTGWCCVSNLHLSWKSSEVRSRAWWSKVVFVFSPRGRNAMSLQISDGQTVLHWSALQRGMLSAVFVEVLWACVVCYCFIVPLFFFSPHSSPFFNLSRCLLLLPQADTDVCCHPCCSWR